MYNALVPIMDGQISGSSIWVFSSEFYDIVLRISHSVLTWAIWFT